VTGKPVEIFRRGGCGCAVAISVRWWVGLVDGCGCGGEAYGCGGSARPAVGGEGNGVGPLGRRLCSRFCWLGNQQNHPPPPNGSLGSEPSLPRGRVCSRLRRSVGRLFVVPTCFKLVGNRGSGVGGSGFRVPGSGVRGPRFGVRGAGCGVRGAGTVGLFLSGFASSLFPLPSSLFRLPTSLFRLRSRDWSLVSGRWAVDV
jgi:hypothetical protein